MKIQPIEFPLGIGTADELRTTVIEGVAYYSLVDTNKTSVMSDGKEVTFKVLHSSNLKLEEGQTDIDVINSMIIELLGVEIIPEQE
jgi:hypothetical protein